MIGSYNKLSNIVRARFAEHETGKGVHLDRKNLRFNKILAKYNLRRDSGGKLPLVDHLDGSSSHLNKYHEQCVY